MTQRPFKHHISPTYEAMSEAAAGYLAEVVMAKPSALICAASGNSPRLTYDLFVQKMQMNAAAKQLKVMTLDEWAGVPQTSVASSSYQIQAQLTDPLGLQDTFLFVGDFTSANSEIARANAFLTQHGTIDVCILGVGTNGHLGLNEPAPFLHHSMHVADIADSTRQHGMITDLAQQPTQGITLGLGDIMAAKKILLLVNGAHKRAVMQAFFERKISTALPVSFLWLHPDVTCFCDESACGGLDFAV